MGKLILVRHGESRWNLAGRFTGWVDVPLSDNGIKEAESCARHCKKFEYTSAFTSTLSRAQETLLIILSLQQRTGVFQHMNGSLSYAKWIRSSNTVREADIPVYANIALNERYYGALQGIEKTEAEKKFGTEKVLAWRRGYKDRPPRGESLEETHARIHPFLMKSILPRVRRGETVLVTAHGNTLRAAIKHLERISEEKIAFIDLPQATPLVYEYRGGNFTRTEGEYRFDRPLR